MHGDFNEACELLVRAHVAQDAGDNLDVVIVAAELRQAFAEQPAGADGIGVLEFAAARTAQVVEFHGQIKCHIKVAAVFIAARGVGRMARRAHGLAIESMKATHIAQRKM